MASRNNNYNKLVVPEAQKAIDRLKMEAATELGIDLKDGYNGDLSARDAGRIGGYVTKKLVQIAQEHLSGK